MGWAKYAEDNMEIYNGRMFLKKGSGFPEKDLTEFKKSKEYGDSASKRRKEYILLLKELRKIETWTEVVNELKGFVGSDTLIGLLKLQKNRLEKNKGEFINYKYDPSFQELWDKENLTNEDFLDEYRIDLGENYLAYIIDKFKELENISLDDSIELNHLTWDLKELLKRMMSVDLSSIEKPVIQYVREEILEEGEHPMIKCKHCNGDTYIDYKTCIVCKYPNEVI